MNDLQINWGKFQEVKNGFPSVTKIEEKNLLMIFAEWKIANPSFLLPQLFLGNPLQ